MGERGPKGSLSDNEVVRLPRYVIDYVNSYYANAPWLQRDALNILRLRNADPEKPVPFGLKLLVFIQDYDRKEREAEEERKKAKLAESSRSENNS